MAPETLHNLRMNVLGMSRREFALASGISEASILRYESGASEIPPWVGLACSALIVGLPRYRDDFAAVARWMQRSRGAPAEVRLAHLGAILTAAAVSSARTDPAAAATVTAARRMFGGVDEGDGEGDQNATDATARAFNGSEPPRP